MANINIPTQGVNPVSLFADHCIGHGYSHGEINPDGAIHRVWGINSNSGRITRDFVYQLHIDGVPTGWCQNHAGGGEIHHWRMESKKPIVSRQERREMMAAVARSIAVRKARAADDAKDARDRAAAIVKKAHRASAEHRYIAEKGISPEGLLQDQTTLIVPVRNIDGELISIQFIDWNGDKRFLKGAPVSGGMWVLGQLSGAKQIFICEGVATAATIYAVMRSPVVASFACSNIRPVAEVVRRANMRTTIVIAADDDWKTRDHDGKLSNPGAKYGAEAARSVRGYLAFPRWTYERPERSTDFNDLARDEGRDAVMMSFGHIFR